MANAPGAVVGTAVLQVIPSMKGGVKGLEKQLNGGMGSMGAKAGQQYEGGLKRSLKGVGGMMGKVLKGGALAVGAAGVAGVGTALTEGFKRLDAIDQAEAKLKGLGHSGKSVSGIMDNALNSVKGTAFGLGDAATVAAGMSAAGVKPGKDLERTLKLVGDTATQTGTGMDEMGNIFRKIAAGGKLTTETMQQIEERGVPVTQYLADETGKSIEQVQKDLSAGNISFETFQKAMEKNIGGAAQESGKTFSGAMANVKAALGRLGASFLSPMFEKGPGIFMAIVDKLDGLGDGAERAGKMVAKGMGFAGNFLKDTFAKIDFSGIGKSLKSSFDKIDFKAIGSNLKGAFSGAWSKTLPVLKSAFEGLRKVAQALAPHIVEFGKGMIGLWPTIKELAKSVGSFLVKAFQQAAPYLKIFGKILGGVFVLALKALPPILKGVMIGLKWMLDALKFLMPVLMPIIAYIALMNIQLGVQKLLMKGSPKAIIATVKATKVWTTAQKLLNAAFRGNPIGMLVTALFVLGMAFVVLYKKNETFRKGVQAAWAKIKEAFAAVVNWFKNTAWPNLRDVFNAIWGFLKKIPGWFKSAGGGIKSAWGKIKEWLSAPIRIAGLLIRGYINVWKLYFKIAVGAIKVIWAVIKTVVIAPIRWVGKQIGKSVAGWKIIFSKVRAGIKVIWDKTKSIVMTPIRLAASWIRKSVAGWKIIFQKARAAIKVVWDKAKSMIMTPVRLAVNWIRKSAAGWKLIFSKARNAINTAWAKLKEMVMKPVRASINWVKRKVDEARVRMINVRNKINAAWAKIKEMINKPIRSAINWAKRKVDEIRARMVSVRDKIRTGWNRLEEMIKKPIRRSVDWAKKKISQLRDTFKTVRDKIGGGWAYLKGKIKSPIKKAGEWIDNNFISGINSMLSKVGVDSDKFEVPKLGAKGWATGGYTGAGGKYTPAGIVHKDEFVLKKEATNRLRKSIGLGGLNYMNQTGRMPNAGGYATGGLVGLPGYAKGGMVYQDMERWFNANFPNKQITSRYRPGAITATGNKSYHGKGKALDMSPDINIFNKIKRTFGSAIRELIYSPAGGRQVHNGKNHRYTGVTRANHWDHVHWAMDSMSDAALKNVKNFLGDTLSDGSSWFEDKVKGWFNGIIGKFSQPGLPGKMVPAVLKKAINGVKGAGGKVVTGMKDKLAGLYDEANPFSGGDSMDFSGLSGSAMVNRWRPLVEKALGIVGQPKSLADRVLNQIRTESGGDPRAINNWDSNAKKGTPSKGLLQTIDSTYNAHAHPKYNKGVYDPLSNILASMRYAMSRYGSLKKAYRGVGYSDGGLVKPLLFDSGGYLPPGVSTVVNKTGKPEPLKRMDGAETPNITVYVQNPFGPDFMESKIRDVVDEEDNYASTLRRMH